MTRTRVSGKPAGFSATAADYAATMAPALAPVAADVVAAALLRPNETVLDVGTGTGTAAGLARGEGRRVIGLDAAPGMLDIARRDVPGVSFLEADFGAIPLDDGAVDVVLAVHALLFAADRVAALSEWRRVARADGRLALSVPGPDDAVPAAIFGDIYRRYGVEWSRGDYPDLPRLTRWAEEAGWTVVDTRADPSRVVALADETVFRTWLRVGRPSSEWDPERIEAFAIDLMAAAPRGPAGSFRVPFGSLHLTARRTE